MNTYEKISKITPEQVTARLAKADKRFVAAKDAATKTSYRHDGALINVPHDVVMPELPTVPPVPQDLLDGVHDVCIPQWSRGEKRDEDYSFTHRSGIFWSQIQIKASASPAQLVAAIKAADGYASQAEQISRGYLASVESAIAAHVASQVDAVNELAGLVAQV